MRKIAIIGGGNVGGQTAALLIKEGLSDILLLDTAKGLAKGKALDLEDFSAGLRQDCTVEGSDDFSLLKDCDLVVITAGLARKPGMTRDDLFKINSGIVKDVSLKIKQFCANPIVVVVTNPVDIMTYLAQKITGFSEKRVFGMGIGLDAARFSNLIRQELNVSNVNIEPVVLGSHGQAMLPMLRLTQVNGVSLEKLLDKESLEKLSKRVVERGAEIVSHLGSGSAYFGPAQAIVNIARAIYKDEKKVIGACVKLNGEYGVTDLYLGAPARIGKNGVEGILELELNDYEKKQFIASAESIRKQVKECTI